MDQQSNEIDSFTLKEGKYNLNNGFTSEWYQLLQDAESGGFSYLVSWTDDGRSFAVHDKDRFVTTILSKISNLNTFGSFKTRLYQYGFRAGPGNSYRHPNFVRGEPEATAAIPRVINPKTIGEEGDGPEASQSQTLGRKRERQDQDSEEKKRRRTLSPSETNKVWRTYNRSELDPRRAILRLSAEKYNLDFGRDFPIVLHNLLQEAAVHSYRYNKTGLSEILSWNPSGRLFQIHRQDLMEEVLDKVSREKSTSRRTRYSVFLETLSRFEFTYEEENGESGWSNDLFHRDCVEAVDWIQARGPPKSAMSRSSTY
jgi:hypothetical protein